MNEKVKEMLGTVLYLLIVLGFTYLVITFVAQRTTVNGRSMETNFHDGDNLIVDKISYRFRDPERFDVIVFPFLYEEDTSFIKRIIGLPGEEINIDADGKIYINGEELKENYGKEVIDQFHHGDREFPILLGDDEYFVMGDNRNDSKDSRYREVGNIKRSNITGRAWVRIWPLSSFGKIKK
ncbi:MAG: signal peptidase I [Lachnospiraceae bacterium]|nr:signal peptidase I [Lachnospiraceae bacterium]